MQFNTNSMNQPFDTSVEFHISFRARTVSLLSVVGQLKELRLCFYYSPSTEYQFSRSSPIREKASQPSGPSVKWNATDPAHDGRHWSQRWGLLGNRRRLELQTIASKWRDSAYIPSPNEKGNVDFYGAYTCNISKTLRYSTHFRGISQFYLQYPEFHPQSEWAIPAFAFSAADGTHLPTPEKWKAE